MLDFYGDEIDFFVVGMVVGKYRVVIFSFFRYDSILIFDIGDWYGIKQDLNGIYGEERKRIILQRSCKLLVYEIGYLLGIDYCIYYDCCMNGLGYLREDFSQFIYFCSVDLYKLQILVGFDIRERYQKLFVFYEKYEMCDEVEWVRKRFQYLDIFKGSL